MFLIRGFPVITITTLLFLSSFTIFVTADSKESDKEEESNLQGDTFAKKQGVIGEDVPDQIAIESNHEPVEHRGEDGPGSPRRPIPFPVSMKAYPGQIAIPLPPGHHGPPPGFRGPNHGPQGQFSAPHPQFFRHQNSGERFQKSKEIYAGSPPSLMPFGQSPNQIHQQNHMNHQQQHEKAKQQALHQQFLKNAQVASGESSKANGFRVLAAPSTHPKIMVPPGSQFPPKPAPGFNGGQQDAHLSNSVFREFFQKQNHPTTTSLTGGIRGHKEISTNDLKAEGGQFGPPSVQYGGPSPAPSGTSNPAWPEGPDGDMPKIVTLEVKCEKSVMRVYVAFDKPFYGVIFSKGHYHNVHCIHLPAGLGHTSANFDIGIDNCGTQGNSENGLYGYGVQSGSGSFFENIIVIQYDPQVQEVWDQARKLRCTWHDQYEKSVTFRPFPVDMLDVVRADFAGDNVGCWMQIQVGKGPWASEVSGLVKIGQSMTMVLAIKDDDNKFDMLVRNCMAHDGVRAPVQLVDQWGCVTRPKLMSKFTKIKNFGQSASVLSYAHFQAFKFPDSMEVHFQCTIQICRYQCPEQCTQPTDGGGAGGYSGHIGKSGLPASSSEREDAAARRRRRAAYNESDSEILAEFSTTFKSVSSSEEQEDVGLNRVITVVSDGDLDFIASKGGFKTLEDENNVPVVESSELPLGDIVCMSTFGFASMLIVLIGTLLIACIFSAVIILRRPSKY